MSRGYQNDRMSYDPYDQDYDSGYSMQTNEYRELYNPYKNSWQQAVKQRMPKRIVNKTTSGNFAGASSEKYSVTRTAKQNFYGNLPKDEQQIFDSGYDISPRNTYGNRTTGYGPRD
ncbi:hypothetical protein [Pontibacter sp. H249]|uniref:hypothetical protein n=1 Tax=Pontibacter sp. H249 TaxID=3133420 RepID=UPI0030BE085D